MESNLRDFLSALEAAGELDRIKVSVSPFTEITQIADRHAKMRSSYSSRWASLFDPDHADLGGQALLFERVEGCDFPLAINVFGSYYRMEQALGCDRDGGFESIADKIAAMVRPKPPDSFGQVIGQARKFMPLLHTPPKLVSSGICQEVIKLANLGEVDLTRLPLIKCWPLDGDPASVGFQTRTAEAGTAGGTGGTGGAGGLGRYITFAGMHTIHADDVDAPKPASHNIGMYRAQLIDETRLVMHWHLHHDGAAHWRSWKKAGKPMPIAICFGGETVLPYAATAPLPPGVSELLMAGFLNGRGIPLVRAATVPLRVPANSEIVIEGFVSTECGEVNYDPRRDGPLGPGAALEGPFGDHTGYYSLPDRYPIVEVTAITHRKDAIFTATIVGAPPQEDYYIGKATERMFLPLLQTLIPDIVDYHLPMFGCFHNCAFLKISKHYALQARRVMHAVWGAGQMAWTKMIIVVDDDVNVHDEKAVLAAMCARCDFHRDIELVNGPLDILDHAAPQLGAGSKIGIDATRKIRGEDVKGVPFERGPIHCQTDDVALKASELIGRAGITDIHVPEFGRGWMVFASVDKYEPGLGGKAIDVLFEAGVGNFIVAVEASVDIRDWESVFFNLCANCDPGRDLHRNDSRIGFDATHKMPGDERNGRAVRDWPPLMEISEEMKQKVQERWREYGFV